MKKVLSFMIICMICLSTVSIFVPKVRAASVDIMLVSRELDNSTQDLGSITVEPEPPPSPPVPNLPRMVTRDTDPLPYQVSFIPPSRHVIHHWEYSGGIYVQDAGMPLPLVNMYVNGPSPALLCAVYEEVPATIHLESREIDDSTSNLGTMDFDGAFSLNLPYDIQRVVSGSPYQATYYHPTQHEFDHWETTDGVSVLDPYIGPTTDVYVSYDGALRAVYKDAPLPPYDATIAAYCYTEGTDPNVLISPAGVYTPHTFTGLTGTNQFTVPSIDPSGHTFRQWNTGETGTTIEVNSEGTYTAYYDLNQKPVAVLDIDPDPPVVSVGSDVWFYGVDSYDPDGDQVVAFFFDYGDDNDSGWLDYPTVAATHPYSAAGEYWARLKVKDDYGLESDWCDPIEITVLPIPGSPVANLAVTPLLQNIGLSVTFDASESYDPDGWIEVYCFDYGDGATEWTSQSVMTHSYSQAGEYYAKVLVSDNNGLETWSESTKVTITQFPVAYFGFTGPDTSFTPDIIYERSTAEFNAYASYDPDGSIVSYQWNFGDGATATKTDAVTNHAFISSGPYTVTLTVTDDKGATASTSKNIFINSLKWEVYFEVDYMTGHEPSDSVLEYIHDYFRDNGIYVYFFVDDEIPTKADVTLSEFWQYEEQYNDVWKFDDRAYGNPTTSKTRLKEKWVLFGTIDATFEGPGRTWSPDTNAGNYIFIADQYNDDWADSLPTLVSREEAEEVVLMHEIGHTIGILVKDPPGTDPDGDGTDEDYDDNSWSVMALGPSVDQCNAQPIRYSPEYWEEKNLEYYTLSGSAMKVAAHSPVNIMVTDPFGRRVGFNVSSGETVNEVPGATYTGPGTEPQEIYIPEPLQGDYIVQAFGSGVGSYKITLESTVNGSITDSETWEGTALPDQQYMQTINLDTDGELASVYDLWTGSFAGTHPIADFAVYNGTLYVASDNHLYVYDGDNSTIIQAPTYVLSLMSYEGKLCVGGEGGLYSFNGTDFALVFTTLRYVKVLGICNNTLYVGTVLDNPPTLFYCNGFADNPDNWYVDTAFSSILNFSGPFGSIDSFAVYNDSMYVTSGGTVYCYSGTDWSIVTTYVDVAAFLDMKVYNGKLYLATRDQAWRKPIYQGYSGFSGRIMEFDGINWTTILDHDYWIYTLETYSGKLYTGTANKIYTYDGTAWETSFHSEEGAYYAISMITYDGKIYAGMGNGYIFVDPSPEAMQTETVMVPEFPSFLILPLFMIATLLAAIAYRRKKRT